MISNQMVAAGEISKLLNLIGLKIESLFSRSESVASRTRSEVGDNETLSLLESSIERLRSRLDQKKRKRSLDFKAIPG